MFVLIGSTRDKPWPNDFSHCFPLFSKVVIVAESLKEQKEEAGMELGGNWEPIEKKSGTNFMKWEKPVRNWVNGKDLGNIDKIS